MKESVVVEKTYAFSLRIVKLYKHLCEERKEYVLSKQMLRSGTSIGANIEEAQGGFSEKDFVYKCTLAYKEARETHYWIRLLRDSDYLEEKLAMSFLDDCDELLRIIGSIVKTMKKREVGQ